MLPPRRQQTSRDRFRHGGGAVRMRAGSATACRPMPPFRRTTVSLLASLLLSAAVPAFAADAPTRQSLDDAWWTGPIIANSAVTLPQGHYLIEPYLFDVISDDAESFGSLTFMLYGATDKLTVGIVPVFGYNKGDGMRSVGPRVADSSVLLQYRLRQYQQGSWLPAVSLQVQHTVPTGSYDQLDPDSADGFGGGAHSTLVQLNTQTYFWMRNGRILRMRLNVGATRSREAALRDVSVYGTPEGFVGRARPGDSWNVNAAWEYSFTRNWVLALDLAYRHSDSTRVSGVVSDGAPDSTPVPLEFQSGSSEAWFLAPAVEYNFSPSFGIIFGTRLIRGRNTTDSVTPVIAFNYVH
jgi:hypothetical protein